MRQEETAAAARPCRFSGISSANGGGNTSSSEAVVLPHDARKRNPVGEPDVAPCFRQDGARHRGEQGDDARTNFSRFLLALSGCLPHVRGKRSGREPGVAIGRLNESHGRVVASCRCPMRHKAGSGGCDEVRIVAALVARLVDLLAVIWILGLTFRRPPRERLDTLVAHELLRAGVRYAYCGFGASRHVLLVLCGDKKCLSNRIHDWLREVRIPGASTRGKVHRVLPWRERVSRYVSVAVRVIRQLRPARFHE